jgi:hypothetical protein
LSTLPGLWAIEQPAGKDHFGETLTFSPEFYDSNRVEACGTRIDKGSADTSRAISQP